MLDMSRIDPHDLFMSYLNGSEVRQRAAELAADTDTDVEPSAGDRYAGHHFRWLAKRTGIPVGTLHNATRDRPQGISLSLVFKLAVALRRADEKISDAVAAIVAEDGPPAEQPADKPAEKPTPERTRDPSSPPPRPDRDRKGPPRTDLKQAS